MCRGADLGVCCELGCDERISCQDTGGYCTTHDPMDWEGPSTNVADDPEKRRVYNLARLNRAISATESAIRHDQQRLIEMRARADDLAAHPDEESKP